MLSTLFSKLFYLFPCAIYLLVPKLLPAFVHQRCQSKYRRSLISVSGEPEPMVHEGPLTFIEKLKRPSHVGIPRARLYLPFAIQLMRSSYSTVDELDFVPMDEFQRTFFLFRQSEWEDYRRNHPTIMQGDLGDALYFDFISFAQYAVISDKIKRGRLEFFEKVNAEEDIIVVKRDPALVDNSLLPQRHSEIVGDMILTFLYSTYPSNVLPVNTTDYKDLDVESRIKQFLSDSQLLLDIFSINAYCLSADISPMESSEQTNITPTDNNSEAKHFLARIKLRAPANLWSLQVLRGRKDNPVNDFELKVLDALSRRRGIRINVVSTGVYDNIDMVHVIKLAI